MDEVAKFESSPCRLPARFTNQIYENGESGMGYTIFAVVFSDGFKQACETGNAVDFVSYLSGNHPMMSSQWFRMRAEETTHS